MADGVLVQIRGSQSPWLEDREPKRTLLIAAGDVTGTVAQAAFQTTEDTRDYLMLLEAWSAGGAVPWLPPLLS